MIPLRYRLRDSVRIEPGGDGSWRVVCESPLGVLTVNQAAVRLLDRTRAGASVAELAEIFGTGEELIFTLCERLRSRGMLEVERAAAGSDQVTQAPPRVSVIVPTRDRTADLDECLGTLAGLDYPRGRLEVIVVDDGSVDPAAVAGFW